MGNNRQPVLERINVRLYADDVDLLDWLRTIPEGGRNQATKDMLRRGIQASERDVLDPNVVRQIVREALEETRSALIDTLSAPDLDRDFVRQVIQETMQDVVGELPGKNANGAIAFDLADVRQVVEVALQEHVDRSGLSVTSPADTDPNEEDEVDALMDTFGQSVLR